MATVEVFGRLGLTLGQAGFAPITERRSDFLEWLAACRNDLQQPAEALVPAVGMVIQALAQAKGCRLARMSGSGATCFGIFVDAESAGAAAQAFRGRGWWAEPTVLG